MSYVRLRHSRRGVLKFQITNSNDQTIPNTQFRNSKLAVWRLEFESLEFACGLEFVIWNFKKSHILRSFQFHQKRLLDGLAYPAQETGTIRAINQTMIVG